MTYLRKMDSAIMVFHLYEEVYNRLIKPIAVETNLNEEDFEKYKAIPELYDEEIWAYSKGIIFLTEDVSEIYMMRKSFISKLQFLNQVCMPAAKNYLSKETVLLSELVDFCFKFGLLNGICNTKNEFDEWLRFEAKSIREKDAIKIADNIKIVLEKVNVA